MTNRSSRSQDLTEHINRQTPYYLRKGEEKVEGICDPLVDEKDFTKNFAIRDAYLSDYCKFLRDKYGF